MSTQTCPSHEELHAYSIGLLSDEVSDAIAAHLASCAECRAGLTTIDGIEDTFVARLRRPAVADPYLEESECRLAVARACDVSATSLKGRSSQSFHVKTIGEYQLLGELGRGGMGTVYKALHTKLDRVVALKVLSRGRMADRQAISRFEREMRAVGKISHPNVVQAFDAREIDGTPVLIMEFVNGLDLGEIVRRIGPLPLAEACETVRRTALALQCANEHGLVHRDIKPSNIMLTAVGEVKLLDLGLARFHAEGMDVSPVLAGEETTGAGQAMGTADYMAPEQASDCRSVDIRADVYSLGCTLYKLLTGRAPFSGSQYTSAFDKMNAHAHQPVPPLRNFATDVPDELAAIVDRMLAKQPTDRFTMPAEVAAALEPFCKGANLADPIVRAMASEVSLSRLPHDAGLAKVVASEQSLKRKPASRRRTIKTLLIGLGFLGALAIGLAAGILIRIKRDGKETAIDVPEGSKARITSDGQVDLTLPGPTKSAEQARQAQPAAVNAAAELKGLEGSWRVVRFEMGEAASSSWRVEGNHDAMNPRAVDFLCFRDNTLNFLDYHNSGRLWNFSYNIDPTGLHKTIDLLFGRKAPFAAGIYEIDGDRLSICLTKYLPSVKSDQRPDRFAAAPKSGDILFVFERYRPSGDEKIIQGDWSIVSRVEDGKPLSDGKGGDQRFSFSDQFVCIGKEGETTGFSGGGGRGHIGAVNSESIEQKFGYLAGRWTLCVLDPEKQPKRMTISTLEEDVYESGYKKKDEILAIFEFDGDRLTIACRLGGPRPEQFESKPGSGVTLLVLRRSKTPPSEDGPNSNESASAGSSAPTVPPVAEEKPPEIAVVRPILRKITHHVDFAGHIEAAQTAEVRPRVSGRLGKIRFESGTMVKEGEVLFELDPVPFQAELSQRAADVTLAQVRLNRAAAELKDANSGTVATSPSDRQRLHAQKAEAEAASAAAEEGWKVAKLNMTSTGVLAPISGKIGRSLVSVSSVVTDAKPLAMIDSVDPMCVAFDVDQRTILALRRNPPHLQGGAAMPVLVGLSDEGHYPRETKVESADTRIDSATGTARWRAMLPNPDGLLMPGMFVRVRLVTSDPYDALLVPINAIFSHEGEMTLFIVSDQGVVGRRTIKIGDREDRMMVVEGVSPDDWVLAEKLNTIHDGMTIKPMKSSAADSPLSNEKPKSRMPWSKSKPRTGNLPPAP